jgi:hypothetical protein
VADWCGVPINSTNNHQIPEWQEFHRDSCNKSGMALTNNRDLRIAALNVERARASRHSKSRVVTHDDATERHKQQLPADLSAPKR